MANEIVIHVEADNGVGPGFAGVAAEAEALGGKIENDLSASGERAGKSMGSEIGSGLNGILRDLKLPEIDVKADSKTAEAQLEVLERQVKALASDDITIDVKAKTNRALAEITKFKAQVADGSEAGEGFVASFAEKVGASSPQALAVIGGLAVAAAPLVGAAISGAVIGGVGLGGIAGGIALAKSDPAVQAALAGLKADVQNELQNAAEPFVEKTIDGLHEIGTAVEHINFGSIFADSASNVQPIFDGVTKAVRLLGAAITDVVHNDAPVLKEIGDEIGAISQVIADGLHNLSDNGKDGANALHELFEVINASVAFVFMLVNGLTEVYGWLNKITNNIPLKFFNDLIGSVAGFSDKTKDSSQSLMDHVGALGEAQTAQQGWKDDLDATTAALGAQDDEINAVANSLKAQTDPLFGFMDATDKLTETQQKYNDAVKKHGENSDEARKAQRDYEKAVINYTGSAAKAAGSTGHLTDEQKNLLRSSGFSKDAIKKLDDQLYDAWKKAQKLDGFNIDITVTQHFKQTGKYISQSQFDNSTSLYSGLAHGGVKGAASGPTSSGLTWTGEDGPELLDLPPGTAVHTKGDSARMAAQASAGGPTHVVLSFDKAGLTGLGLALAETLRADIRTGGGNVQEYLGVPGA